MYFALEPVVNVSKVSNDLNAFSANSLNTLVENAVKNYKQLLNDIESRKEDIVDIDITPISNVSAKLNEMLDSSGEEPEKKSGGFVLNFAINNGVVKESEDEKKQRTGKRLRLNLRTSSRQRND